MALSAHKLHGPKGVGALVARDPAAIPPLLWGGGQEHGLRSGTENVPGIVGFAAALEAVRGRGDRRRELRDRLESAVERTAGVSVVSRDAERLAGHVLILVEGLRADLLVLALDDAGYAVAAGSACAAGSAAPSHVLLAQGLTPDDARSVVRVSIGLDTSAADVDGFARALAACTSRLRAGALPVTDVA
jgi:cysteine desulfurase